MRPRTGFALVRITALRRRQGPAANVSSHCVGPRRSQASLHRHVVPTVWIGGRPQAERPTCAAVLVRSAIGAVG